MTGILFLIGGYLKSAFAWLASLPWYVLAIAALILFGGWEARKASIWHERAVVAEKALKAVRDAQAAADKAARNDAKHKDTANADNSKGTTDALHNDLARAGTLADTLRLRVADLERQARARHQAGGGTTASGVDAEDDPRLALGDELALRQECQAEVIKRSALIDWETRRIEIEETPPHP